MPQIQAGSLYAAKIGHLSPATFDIFGAVHQKLFTIFKAVPDRSRLFLAARIKILNPFSLQRRKQTNLRGAAKKSRDKILFTKDK